MRKITRSKWLKDSWISDDDVPATALTDVGECEISVYEVPDSETARRIAIAIAAGCDHFDKVEYAVFEADMDSLNIDVSETIGTTHDQAANVLHRNLVNMTVRTACGLAQIIGNNQNFTRLYRKDVEVTIIEYCRTGILDRNKLSEKMRAKIPAGN